MEKLYTVNMTEENSSNGSTESVRRLVSSLVGNSIFNPAGETLGKVNDIMIDIAARKVEYIIMESGGFLGMNHKYFAVPLQALSIAKEHQDAFILNDTKESLKRYPEFDKEHWPDMSINTSSRQ
jgi:sporulation protein YlmC with PRC-barrel domain